MVALADMIVVLNNFYFHIFSWYACSLQCATNTSIVNHVTPRVLDLRTLYYIHNEIHKQPPKNNRQAQILQHMDWRIAVGTRKPVCVCTNQGFNFSAGRGQSAQAESGKRQRERGRD